MTLIARLTRLLQADLHDVLDSMEEPASLLRQSVREMEEALATDERRLEGWRHEHAQMLGRCRDLDHALRDIAEQLDTCFEAGGSELARALIRRRLETQRLQSVLAQQAQALEERCAFAQSRLQEQRARLECLRHRATSALQPDRSKPAGACWQEARLTVTEAEIDIALLREQQRRATP